MNSLPNEVLCKILGYLNYNQLLVAKNVCRLWRDSVGYVINYEYVTKRRPVIYTWAQEDRLYVNAIKKDEENHTPFWNLFYEKDNRLNRLNPHLVSGSWKSLRFISDYHECIKKLVLSNPYLINYLNTLVNLEELQILAESWLCIDFQLNMRGHNWEQIECLEFENLDDVFALPIEPSFKRTDPSCLHLKLRALKKLHFISDFNFKKIPIILSCPALRTVITDVHLDWFRFKFPAAVEEITCEENSPLLVQFRNLRKLTCYYFNLNCARSLKNFKNLQEFYFYKMEDIPFAFAELKPIRIYYKDLQLLPSQTWPSQLRSLSPIALNDSALEFYSRNVQFLSETAGLAHKELRLDCLQHVAPEVLRRLGNLRQVYINYREANQKDYIEVFKASNLKKLTVKSSFICSVDQKFLNIIPVHCPFLRLISLDDFQDLSFCLNLKYLKCLKTEQFFSFHMMQKLFDYLPSLSQIEVHIHVDIFKFEVRKEPLYVGCAKSRPKHSNPPVSKVVCSYNDQTFLEQSKKQFISSDNRTCIWKLYELFFANYKEQSL